MEGGHFTDAGGEGGVEGVEPAEDGTGSNEGGGDPGQDIRDRNFPYPFGNDFSFETPKGVYENMWNHLSFNMKNAFYDVFKNGARLNIEEWIDKIKEYKEEMEMGNIYQKNLLI